MKCCPDEFLDSEIQAVDGGGIKVAARARQTCQSCVPQDSRDRSGREKESKVASWIRKVRTGIPTAGDKELHLSGAGASGWRKKKWIHS